jgi:hypothetical protein
MDKKPTREKLAAKILFWGIAVPAVFTFFLKIFFLFFNFIYGYAVVQIVGQDYAKVVTVIALITSIGFTIGVIVWVHMQFKKHILTTF